MTGLTIIGVGPGDPTLLTLLAVEEIEKSTLISFPVASPGEESMAARIASKWISEDKQRLPLHFPMVNDQEVLRSAWEKASDAIAAALKDEKQVAFLCQGDPSLFASGSYLLLEMKSNHPNCPVKLIPGVTSFAAAG